MSYPIADIDDIGPDEVLILKRVGIRTTSRLLEATKSPKDRRKLAAKTGIDEKRLLKWANAADRMRIKGVGDDYAELIAAAGVLTVRDLKHRNAKRLTEAMAIANRHRKLVDSLPSEEAVAGWIEHAKQLPLKIMYRNEPPLAELTAGVSPVRFKARAQEDPTDPSSQEKPRQIRQRERTSVPEKGANPRKLRLAEIATKTFGDAKFADEWLRLPNPALNNRIPNELSETKAGACEVETVLSRIAHGDFT